MNLEALIARSRQLSGIRQEAIKSDDDFAALINEAYRELSGIDDWPWLYLEQYATVPSGQREVVLDTALRNINGVLFSGRRLHNVTLSDLDHAEIEREGDPYAYARLDHERILLVPAPDEAGEVRVRGVRQVDDLEDSEDEPVFDPEFHHILAYAAAARALIEEGDDSGRSGAYAQDVQSTLRGMEQRYLESHESSVFQWGGRATTRRRWRLR